MDTTWRHRLGLFKSECIYRYLPGRMRAMKAFYQSLVSPGDLCFDLGSHVGNRADVLSSLGCSVVAVEPHPYLANYLRRRFSGNRNVVVDERGVSDVSGEGTLYSSPRYLSVSSLDSGWVDSLQAVRSHDIAFTESFTVETTTVGELMAEYGVPRYCKIDVEGSDLTVIQSMPVPVEIVSFEHLPHRLQATAVSIASLGGMSDYRYNYFVRESHRFRLPIDVTSANLLQALQGIAGRRSSCDVFAFRQP